jgi:hypothetical protein
MHDALVVRYLHRLADLNRDAGRKLARAAPFALQSLAQRLPVEQLHRQVRHAAIGAIVVHVHDVRSPQQRRRARLALEAQQGAGLVR